MNEIGYASAATRSYAGETDAGELSTFITPAKQARSGLSELTARLNSLATRLTGPVPPNAAATQQAIGKLASVPNGVFDEVAELGRNMNASLADAFDAINRIERALP